MTSASKETITSFINENFEFLYHVKMVPPFQEHEVDKFSLHFKKIAANLHWSSEVQTVLVQSVFIGKAREVYSALSVEKSTDYDWLRERSYKPMN